MKLQSALLLFLAAGPGALAFQTARPITRPWGTCMSMSTKAVEVKRLADSAVEIQIPVPGSATKAAYDKVCNELSKSIQIPGFRKGSKIPPQVLEQNMAAKGGRNALKVQAINELVNQLIEPSLKEHALDPIGTPSLVVSAEELAESFKSGEELTLQVKCDVWPEIQWKPTPEGKEKVYFGLKGKYKRKPFNQEKLDMALRDLKERYATLQPIDDPNHVLEMGDACTVNMEGFMAAADGSKGEALPNAASGDNVEVVLGPGRYMEGLVEGIVGHKKGDKVTVDVCFPEKLRDKSLAGKRALFDVEILDCSKRSVPEITDEFAQKVKDGLTAESLMAELRKAIDEEDAKEFVPDRNAALSKSLAECMDVQVPDTLVTNQAREKFAMMMAEMRDGGVDDAEIKRQINPENFAKYKDIVKDEIIRDFKVSMATDEIARLEGLTVPDYQIEEQMQAIRKDAEGSEDFDENMVRMKVETTLQRQAVFDFLAERAELEVEYEDAEFDEKLMERLAEESLKREEQIAAEVSAPEPVAEPVVEEKKPEPVAEKKPEPVAEKKPEPVVEKKPEPVVEKTPEPVAEEKKEESKPVERDWASMTLEEKAYAALVDAGAFEPNESSDDKA